MLKKTILLCLIIIYSAAEVCRKDNVDIDTSPGEASYSNKRPTLLVAHAAKEHISETAHVKLFRATRRYMYCMPKIRKEESPKCRENTEAILYTNEDMRKALQVGKCLSGKTCAEYGCKGDDSQECFSQNYQEFIGEKELVTISKATSLLWSTCIQYWGCRIREVDVNLHLLSDGQIRFDDPIYGEFIIPNHQTKFVRGKIEGNYAHIISNIERGTSDVSLTCLREEEAHLCYEEESRKVVTVSPKLKTCVGGSCLTFRSNNFTYEEEAPSLGDVPTQYDLMRTYRLLQYQGIQALWDISQLHERSAQIEKVLGRVIEVLSLNSTDILSSLTSLLLKPLSSTPGTISARVCRSHHEAERALKDMSGPSPVTMWLSESEKGFQVKKARLFWSGMVLNHEVSKPAFEIDRLSYSDIAKLEGGQISGPSQGSSSQQSHSVFPWSQVLSFLSNTGIFLGWLSAFLILLAKVRSF